MKSCELISESNMHRGLAHIVKLVKNKFSNGDYVDALRCMGEYGLTYADVPKELQDFIYSRRRQIIQELLDILKNNLEYKDIYNWTNNLPEGSKDIFLKIIEYFNINHIDKKTNILEIGTYTGI